MGPFDPQTNSTLAKLWSTLVGRRWVLKAGLSPALRTQGVVGAPNLSALSRYVAGARAPAHRASVLRVQGPPGRPRSGGVGNLACPRAGHLGPGRGLAPPHPARWCTWPATPQRLEALGLGRASNGSK